MIVFPVQIYYNYGYKEPFFEMTLGFSRDDVAKFLPVYLEKGILKHDPFQVLDHLLAGYPKQDKLEQIIKHGVELGAAHFVPFFSRYCVAAPKKEEQKNERYNRIALEAAKQCGRGVLPDVALPLPNFGAVCRTFDQYDLVLFCYECGGAPVRQLLAEAAPADGKKRKIAIVTGAEGGFAAEERSASSSSIRLFAYCRSSGFAPDKVSRSFSISLSVFARATRAAVSFGL